MQTAAGYGPVAPAATVSAGLLVPTIVGIVLVVAGTGLGIGLGVGLHDDAKNLTIVTPTVTENSTTTTTSTTSTTTTTSNTTTTTTTTTNTTTASSVTTTTTAATSTNTTTPTSFQSTYSSSLTGSSPVYGGFNQSATNFNYEAIQVVPNVNGTYTFTATSGSNLRLLGYLYNNSFLVNSPSTNLIARDDSTTGSLQFNLSSPLQANAEYILVVTTANGSSTGPFTVTSTGPGNVTYTARSVFTQTLTYGTVSNNNTNDFSNGTVTINLNDTISGVDGTSITGYVNQISINFAIAPVPNTGVIFVYVLSRTENTLVFTPTTSYQIPAISLANATGVQTFTIPRNQLPVVNGQYVGLGLGTGGGSAFMSPGLTEAFLLTTNIATLTAGTYTLEPVGNAFSYRVFTAGRVVG